MSQEELAFDACTAGTISKIENGVHVPTRALLQELLERLGGMGFFHSYYIERAFYEEMQIKQKILKALECSDMEDVPDLLCSLKNCCDKNNPHSLQFIEFIKYYFWQSLHFAPEGFEKELTRIMRITYPDFGLSHNGKRVLLDCTECLILNYMALLFLYNKEYAKAYELFVNLLITIQKGVSFLPGHYKAKAAVLNNIAICKLQIGDLKDAIEIINYAVKICAEGGEILLFIKILRTRALVSIKANDYESFQYDMEFIKKGYRAIPKDLLRKKDYRAFMKEPKGLMFF